MWAAEIILREKMRKMLGSKSSTEVNLREILVARRTRAIHKRTAFGPHPRYVDERARFLDEVLATSVRYMHGEKRLQWRKPGVAVAAPVPARRKLTLIAPKLLLDEVS